MFRRLNVMTPSRRVAKAIESAQQITTLPSLYPLLILAITTWRLASWRRGDCPGAVSVALNVMTIEDLRHKCFRMKVAIFQASIAFQGMAAMV